MKKVEPKALSGIQKGASMYSKPWHVVKISPKVTVKYRPIFEFLVLALSISWWVHVTDTPEDKRRIVFSNGILIGLNDVIERGGQLCPSSGVGEILL